MRCAARRREAVEAHFAVGFRDAPLGGDPAFDEHFLQRGIEQAFFDGEDFAGEQVDALGDGVAMQRAGLEHAEDEHGERAGRHSVFRPNRHRHHDIMPQSACQGEGAFGMIKSGWLMQRWLDGRAIAVVLLICAGIMAGSAQSPASGSAPASVSIRVDLAKSLGPYTPIYRWFGYDESNYTTMQYGKQLLRELHDLTPEPVYIRAHHLLTSGNGVAEMKWSSSNVFSLDANGKAVYDFTITDQTFDEYQRAGVRPFVELGFMPKDLASNVPGVNEYQVHYPRPTMAGASNNPPKDYAMWGELVRKFTEHLVERYGRDKVSTWYFEVWNEPDIVYWHGTQEEYTKLYDYAVAGVRAALPDAKVGGPATTGPGSEKSVAFLDGFLNHCLSGRSAADGKAVPLDFISFHPKGHPETVDGHVRNGPCR